MASNRSHSGVIASAPAARLLAAAMATILVAACASPGTVSSPTSASIGGRPRLPRASPNQAPPPPAAPPRPCSAQSPSAAVRGSARPHPRSAAAGGPTCGTDPVELNADFETGFPTVPALADEFTKQFPNVTFKVSQDQFANLMTSTPRLLSSDNPPDLIRLPTLISLVKDDLLKNLDDYATAFGWDKWPAAQLVQNRVSTDGTRGSGSLYAMGLNNSLTGVFYNKKLAQQIGMTEPPKTVADFEALLAKAKSAGLLPIMVWNSAKSGGGLAFPLQQLMAAYGPTQPINEWIFQKKGATIDTPDQRSRRPSTSSSGSSAATSRRTPTPSSTPTPTPASARAKACSCSTATGRTAATTRTSPATSASSCSHPPKRAAPWAAMSSPLTFGIAKTAKHADCAAFFFNWVATNDKARDINVKGFGSNPGGPADLPIPPVAAGSVTKDTLAAGAEVAKANGAMDFIANATGSIFAQGWTPELQKMVGGKQDAAGLLKAVQAEYAKELAAGS